MAEPADNVQIVLTTTATIEAARHLAVTLVQEGLAACATAIPAVQSVYRWEGKVESASETMLLLKTDAEHLPALEQRLYALHSYEVPEFLVLPVKEGGAAYLKWLAESLRPL